ncbi:MAG: hypothetical protein K2I99_03490, partial [Bacteroidaceae bacterium]|nr:hypothetical protein [Bacteroidaceae bacterium]
RLGGRGQRRGAVQENMVRDSKLMWTLGNFSRFVRPDAVRLDVQGEMAADGLMLSAYRNADGTLAIVAINYGTQDRPVCIDTQEGKSAIAYRTSDVAGENLKNVGKVNLKKSTLPARSVTTYIVL